MSEENENEPVSPRIRKGSEKKEEEEPAEEEAVEEEEVPETEAGAPGGPFGPNAQFVQMPPELVARRRAQESEEPSGEEREEAPPAQKPGRRMVDMTKSEAGQREARPDDEEEPATSGEMPPSDTSPDEASVADRGKKPQVKKEPEEEARPESMMGFEDGSVEDFEALLAAEGDVPEQRDFSRGDLVDGEVIEIGDKWVHVDLGGATEALAKKGRYTDEEGEVHIAVGDRREFYITDFDDGTIIVGEQLATGRSALDALYTAEETGAPVEGRVAERNKGGFEVDVGGVRAFCPVSQIELSYTEDPDVHIGNTYRFRVQEIRDEGQSVVVSRAALLREEMSAKREKTLEDLEVGMKVRGVVTRVTDFGAFVDIGGIEGLVHVSELGYQHVTHPGDVVSEGDNIDVEVTKIEGEGEDLRIGLSRKAVMEDPWLKAAEELHEGAKVEGPVVRVESFGAFVEVAPGVEGLVHVSELSWEHVKRPEDVVSVGDEVTAEIQSIDPVRRRISLSMKGAQGDPWTKVEEKYNIGDTVEGKVENIEDFGVFVNLGGGLTALIPRSEMDVPDGATPHSRYSRDEDVTARVLSIDPERRRMALTTKSREEIEEATETLPSSYDEDDSSESSGSFGTLGDLLKDKVGDKE